MAVRRTQSAFLAYRCLILSLWGYCSVREIEGAAFGDFWKEGDKRSIHLKEAEALLKAVQSLGLEIKNHRLDILTDNKQFFFLGKIRAVKIGISIV